MCLQQGFVVALLNLRLQWLLQDLPSSILLFPRISKLRVLYHYLTITLTQSITLNIFCRSLASISHTLISKLLFWTAKLVHNHEF